MKVKPSTDLLETLQRTADGLEAQALDYDEYFSLAGKKFVEDETGNEDLLSFDEYMNQLTDLEVDLLYTAYYQDFLLFGYDAWE